MTRPVRPGGAVSGPVVLLVTSPAVRPGLLSWPAWQTLGGAAQVLAASAEHPLLPYLDEAGIGWAVLPGAAGAGPGELARLLTAAAAAQPGPVVWLPAAEPPGSVDHDVVPALARELGGAAEVVTGSAGLPGAELLVLVEVMDTLRRRCPWDARQTHESLAPFLLEESYEALDALESGDRAALREELGDVLLQVMFHARVAAERADGTGFTIDDVADGIVSKLVRRHPHVFADVAVSGAEDVKRNWDEIKAAEREAKSGAPTSALDGVPLEPAGPGAGRAAAAAGRAGRRPGRAGRPGRGRPGRGRRPAGRPAVRPGGQRAGGWARSGTGAARRGPPLRRPGARLGAGHRPDGLGHGLRHDLGARRRARCPGLPGLH